MGRTAHQRGIALFEGALWLAVLLPISLVLATTAAVVHDQAALRVVPEAALREVPGGTLRWTGDGFGGRYEADVVELRSAVSRASELGLLEAQKTAFKAHNISTKACFWIFSVNPSTGKLQSPIQSECDARGPLSREVTVEPYMQEALPRRLGVPRGEIGRGAGYVDRVVLMGMAIVGELPDLLRPSMVHRVSYGAISFPRQEISL